MNDSGSAAAFVVILAALTLLGAVTIMPKYFPPNDKKEIDIVYQQKQSMKKLSLDIAAEFKAARVLTEQTKGLVEQNLNETLANRSVTIDSKHAVMNAIQVNRIMIILLMCLGFGSVVAIIIISIHLSSKR